MIPTPDLSHLTKRDYDMIYEPAEDTFILLDALEAEADIIRSLAPRVCLEIGSGTGVVSSFLGQIVGVSNSCPCSMGYGDYSDCSVLNSIYPQKHLVFLCTDINPHAATCTSRTGSQNKIPLDPVVASLTRPLTSRLAHAVDILVFNPPYVPTYSDEMGVAQRGSGIAGSWAGGVDGMEVTNALLGQVDGLLSPRGRFYLVAVKQNNVPQIQEFMENVFSLRSEIVLQRRAGCEHLFVLRISR